MPLDGGGRDVIQRDPGTPFSRLHEAAGILHPMSMYPDKGIVGDALSGKNLNLLLCRTIAGVGGNGQPGFKMSRAAAQNQFSSTSERSHGSTPILIKPGLIPVPSIPFPIPESIEQRGNQRFPRASVRERIYHPQRHRFPCW